jgi:hypothetical protein
MPKAMISVASALAAMCDSQRFAAKPIGKQASFNALAHALAQELEQLLTGIAIFRQSPRALECADRGT